MKNLTRFIFLILTLALALALTACGGSDAPAEPADAPAQTEAALENGLTDTYDDALSIKNQLLLGTIRLDGTDNAIEPAQAAQLVPMWIAMRSLTESGTAADAEITAVQNQIIGLMTPAQIAAIAAMKLTNADTQAYYVEIGASTPSTPEAEPAEGEVPMSELSKEDRQATKVAQGTPVGSSSGSGKGTILLDNVIELLQGK